MVPTNLHLVRVLCVCTLHVGGAFHSNAQGSDVADQEGRWSEKTKYSASILAQRSWEQEFHESVSQSTTQTPRVSLRNIDDIWNDLQREQRQKKKEARSLKAKL